MEFFDFDQASHGQASTPQAGFRDLSLPSSASPATPYMSTIDDDLLLEVADEYHESYTAAMEQKGVAAYADDGVRMNLNYQLAKEPCDYCRERQLRCFIVDWQSAGCSACMSLFRPCSLQPASAQTSGLQIAEVAEVGVTEDAEGGGRAMGPLEPFPSTFPSLQDRDSQNRKGTARFSRAAVKTLKDWLAANAAHPYPTEEQKDDLKRKTGLKTSQISNWLANARRRGKVPLPRRSMDESMPVDFPSSTQSYSSLNPLDRWKASPPEHEPASVSAIANALATTPYHHSEEGSSSHSSSWAEHAQDTSSQSSFSVFRAPSISSGQSRVSSGSLNSDLSFGSVFSNQSSRHSFGSVPRERRRRRRVSARNSATSADAAPTRPFQCTFCTVTFKTKHDWQRHEKSLHLSLEKWTCSPLGGVIRMPEGNLCVFCSALNPDEDHLESHNFSACQEKVPSERTFYRKDHLRQHLHLMHGCKFDVSMEAWKSTITEIRSRCGFCGPLHGSEEKIFTTWQQRADHLASHFRNGTTMFEWKGDWGLEPHILPLVELDPSTARMQIAKYNLERHKSVKSPTVGNNPEIAADPLPSLSPEALAALNLQDPNPSSNAIRRRRGPLSTPSDGNGSYFCKVVLARMLSEYARGALAQGHTPGDLELQDEARAIVFRDRDPWNQTVADNPDWLEVFKRQNGFPAEGGDGNIGGQWIPPASTLDCAHWGGEDLPVADLTSVSGDEAFPAGVPNCPKWTGKDYPPFPEVLEGYRKSGELGVDPAAETGDAGGPNPWLDADLDSSMWA